MGVARAPPSALTAPQPFLLLLTTDMLWHAVNAVLLVGFVTTTGTLACLLLLTVVRELLDVPDVWAYQVGVGRSHSQGW